LVIFSVSIWIFLFTISFYLLYIGYNVNTAIDGGWKGRQTLYALGFAEDNPNYAARYFLSLIVFLYLFARFQKNRYNEIIVHIFNILLIITIYWYTGSRTPFFSEVLLYIFMCFIRRRKTRLANLILCVPLFCLITAFVMPLIFSKTIVNYFLSGRLSYQNKMLFSLTPVNFLIGGPVMSGVIIDSSYINLFLCNGVIGVVFFLYLYLAFFKTITTFSSMWQKYYKYIPVLVTLSIASLSESLIAGFHDISIIYFIILLSSLKEKKYHKGVMK
jgi:hypothetical protein